MILLRDLVSLERPMVQTRASSVLRKPRLSVKLHETSSLECSQRWPLNLYPTYGVVCGPASGYNIKDPSHGTKEMSSLGAYALAPRVDSPDGKIDRAGESSEVAGKVEGRAIEGCCCTKRDEQR